MQPQTRRTVVAETGVMIWQGVLEDEKDIARVQVPIPADWWKEAEDPFLRLVVVWDPPVNAAVKHLWATQRCISKAKSASRCEGTTYVEG